MKNLISLYLHIPFCAHKCHYCAFYSSPQNFDLIPQYVNALELELVSYQKTLHEYQIETIFFGGGTPSLIESKYITQIVDFIKANFFIMDNAEITIECNPETLTTEKLHDYHQAGINRLSVGMQAWQNDLLKYLGRTYTNSQFTQAIQLIKHSTITNFNTDLIFGIPGQTMQNWEETLDRAISFKPKHISAYSLMIEKDTTFHRLYKLGKLKKLPEELDRKMYHYAVKTLEQAGYQQYEISNFAMPGFECRHNYSFWNGGEYLGIGVSASSYVNHTISTNLANTKKYIEYLQQQNPPNQIQADKCHPEPKKSHHDESNGSIQNSLKSETYSLSPEQIILHHLFLNLRLTEGVNINQFNSKHSADLYKQFSEQIKDLVSTRLITQTPSHLALTRKGMDLENQVAEIFAS